MSKRTLLAIIVAFVVAITSSAAAAGTYSVDTSLADGMVTTARQPTVIAGVSDGTVVLSDVRITLDGRQMPRIFDATAGFGWYVPAMPLALGRHTVKFDFFYQGNAFGTASLSFTVVPEMPRPAIDSFDSQETIDVVNEIRAKSGIPAVAVDRSLTVSAQRHADYVHANREIVHDEIPGKPGFSGVRPANRAQMAGFVGITVSEVGTGEEHPVRSAVHGLLAAPYHRLAILNPNYQFAGAGLAWDSRGSETGALFINFGTKRPGTDERVVLYPYPGQTDAPVAWQDFEVPSPLRFFGQKRGATVGYPVTVSYHDGRTAHLTVLSAEMTDENGAQVPSYVADSSLETDKVHGQDRTKQLIIIPKKPLAPGVPYSVRVKGIRVLHNGTALPVDLAWSFTTAAELKISGAALIARKSGDYIKVYAENGAVRDLAYVLLDLERENPVVAVASDSVYGPPNTRIMNGAYRLEVFSKTFGAAQVFEATISGTPEKRRVTLKRIDSPPKVSSVGE